MGCDGGTIPRRDELVRVKKKPETKDKDSSLAFQWRCCAITQETLQEPIVACGLGRLYSKVSLIEALLNKKELLPASAKHVRSLKDVRDLQLTPNPAHAGDATDEKGGAAATRSAPYICPVIGLEMSGKFRFVALWTCGCVFSERARKEVPPGACPKCQQPFADGDVVVINASTEDDLQLMHSRMEARQAALKKDKKKVKIETAITTSTCSTKVLPSKRPGALEAPKQHDEKAKKAKPDYSVAKDPNATDVYKSLFTTHKSEKEQGRAHWITYNPFYN